MKINKVTFTGADERTKQKNLYKMFEKHPKIEWGILLSKNNGRARYPGTNWIEDLVGEYPSLPISFHFCGEYVKEMISGDFAKLELPFIKGSSRIQINFHNNDILDCSGFLEKIKKMNNQFIFQVNDKSLFVYEEAKIQCNNVFPLFDKSAGTGTTPDSWPISNGYAGYAGGLGPDNLLEELSRINLVSNEVWIDFETKVRNNFDEFDLNIVETCYQIASRYF